LLVQDVSQILNIFLKKELIRQFADFKSSRRFSLFPREDFSFCKQKLFKMSRRFYFLFFKVSRSFNSSYFKMCRRFCIFFGNRTCSDESRRFQIELQIFPFSKSKLFFWANRNCSRRVADIFFFQDVLQISNRVADLSFFQEKICILANKNYSRRVADILIFSRCVADFLKNKFNRNCSRRVADFLIFARCVANVFNFLKQELFKTSHGFCRMYNCIPCLSLLHLSLRENFRERGGEVREEGRGGGGGKWG